MGTIFLRRYSFHGLTEDERKKIPGRARTEACAYARAHGVPDTAVEDLQCCIGEAVKNAVRFAADGTGITVSVACWPGRYRWIVSNDGGAAFDLEDVLAREAETTITDEEHGRGFLLMCGLMDAVKVSRVCEVTTVEGVLEWEKQSMSG